MTKRILLVQVRDDREAREHELECFVRQSGLGSGQVLQHDLTTDGLPEDLPDGTAGVVVGGSGDYSGHGDYPNRASLESLVRKAEKEGLSVLGICFGSQVVAESLGGKAVEDRSKSEVGTCRLRLLEAGKNDSLFSLLPDEFLANEGHHSWVERLPEGAVPLAVSGRCPNQAFRSVGGSVCGIQFHPELDREALLWRLGHYNEDYGSQVHPDVNVGETPEVPRLLRVWAERTLSV